MVEFNIHVFVNSSSLRFKEILCIDLLCYEVPCFKIMICYFYLYLHILNKRDLLEDIETLSMDGLSKLQGCRGF